MNRMVLLIDPDSGRRERLREALFSTGLTALGSGNTDQGLHILIHNPVSVVVVAEPNWRTLSSFCSQSIKRWPKTKIFVLVDVLPDDLDSAQISHFHPNILPKDFADAVNQTIRSAGTEPTFQLDIDVSGFEDSVAEAEPVAPGAQVPSFIDFGGGAPSAKPPAMGGGIEKQVTGSTGGTSTPKNVPSPLGFDFEIPVPPLAATPAPAPEPEEVIEELPLDAVQIEPGELELIVEEDVGEDLDDLLWDSVDSNDGEPIDLEMSSEESEEEVLPDPPGMRSDDVPKQRMFFGGKPLDDESPVSAADADFGEEVLLEVEEDDEVGELLDLDVEPLPDPLSSTEGTPHFDLDLSSSEIQGAPGAVWLMKIASEKENGRLFISEGPAKGVLYFANGEGVWAEFDNGVDELRDYLLQKDLPTPGGMNGTEISEGEYLFRMVENDALPSEEASQVILDLVRDRILKLAFEGWGDFRFERDEAMAKVPPMLSVHPFGLILESRQRELAPTDLIGLSSELEHDVLKPGPASTWVGNTLDRYLNNLDLDSFLEQKRTVADFFTESALGPITGTLMVLALRDTQVITTKHVA
ncbi:MAG: hypothetical protein CMH56_05860 [Myxococcales bacterium]|nr:hypothetical protein [Myxococcales bacterium]